VRESGDTTSVGTDSEAAAKLRDDMVGELVDDGVITSAAVEAAMRVVPRHLFTPDAGLDEAYRPYDSLVTIRDAQGRALSSVSAPQLQAFMLEQAGIEPGMRVLEVGSGGYNAALLAELAGPGGEVTTMDIDPQVTSRARRLLTLAGYPRVAVVLADAEDGVPSRAPFDRILVTAGAWDVPPAWMAQLAEDGRLLVPLRIRGLTRTLTFAKDGDHLVSRSSRLFGFVPLQGAGAHQAGQIVLCSGELTVLFDDGCPPAARLSNSTFTGGRTETWTGVQIGRTEPLDEVQMWLAASLPGFCQVRVDLERSSGLVTPIGRHALAQATAEGRSLAYLTARPAQDTTAEFGVHAYGPDRDTLAQSVATSVQDWDSRYRNGPGPVIGVYPADTPDDRLPAGRVVDKKHSRITITWPEPEGPAGQDGSPTASGQEGETHVTDRVRDPSG
jgi:protein-L-isoaspartate(D-aspartate) O-methyltransferase